METDLAGFTVSPLSTRDPANPGKSSLMVNGRRYEGRTVEMRGGRIIVDGRDVNEDEPEEQTDAEGRKTKVVYRTCTLQVVGHVDGDIRGGSADITVNGSVRGSIKTASGNVAIRRGSVGGDASSMSGNVEVGGDCGGRPSSMSGNVSVAGRAPATVRIEPIVEEPIDEKRVEEIMAAVPLTPKKKTPPLALPAPLISSSKDTKKKRAREQNEEEEEKEDPAAKRTRLDQTPVVKKEGIH
jgi:hypothetical protein